MKTVLSASRRTDVPAFYMGWFMKQIRSGAFEVVNPYNQKRSSVRATADAVHTIVFWSKNFGPFIEGNYGAELLDKGFHLFFNFTINSDDPLLEPEVPPLSNRLKQLDELCRVFGSECVAWRFDPICFYIYKTGETRSNLKGFSRIAGRASGCGVSRCVTSFLDIYPKIRKRTASMAGFEFVDPPLETKRNLLLDLRQRLGELKIELLTCCEKEVLDTLPAEAGIKPNACIPNRLLVELFGGALSFRRDTGQRRQKGCGCLASVDVGSYHLHPCRHNCLFCYANPAPGKPVEGKPQST